MAFSFPENIKSIFTDLANDVKNLINKSNPFKLRSLTKAILTAFAGKLWHYYSQIQELIDQNFDDTRTGTYLVREASDYGITKKEATVATGQISVTGTPGTVIPDLTKFNFNDLVYKVDGNTTITNKTKAVNINYDTGVVTVVFTDDHNLGTGQELTISGATPAELNGTFEVSVINAQTLQYEAGVAGTGATTGNASYDNAVCTVNSEDYGEESNRESGEELDIGTGIVGVDSQAVVTYNGIIGGTDEEDEEELRSRLQQRKKNPASFFNESQVESILRENVLVDRVFIDRVTPSVGFAQIYFVKEDNEIPSSAEVNEVKDYFEPYLPINDDYSNIGLQAPTALTTNFNFVSIDPDTPTMQTAIEDNLDAFFKDKTEVGKTITEEVYRGVIINTVDPDSLTPLNNFNLITPVGDIAPTTGELPVLGTVTF